MKCTHLCLARFAWWLSVAALFAGNLSAAEWTWTWTPAPGDKVPTAEVCLFKYGKVWADSVEIDDGPKWARSFAEPFLAGHHYTDARLLASSALEAQTNQAQPTVWMGPPSYDNGKCFRELFEKPDEWKETRALVDVLFYTDLNLKKQFTDEELQAWLPRLKEWNIKLAMEVGAIKPWGQTGEKTFNIERPMWTLGGNLYAIALDEPLCCARKEIHKPDSYAVQETANHITLVRKHYPQLLIGDIEPYPFISYADLLTWIDALQARLKAMNVRGLDFFRLDVDWNHFTIGNAIHPGNWPEVRKLEAACRQRKMPFSLIYWAADYGRPEQLKLADDATWYIGVMRQGNDHAFVGGAPDQVVIESWINAPSRSVPETDEWTFTRSV